MSTIILIHIVAGLAGIVAGLVSIAGILRGARLPRVNAIFLLTTATACATGFVFLPTGGLTSAQLVAFFIVFLLSIAIYARCAARLAGGWNAIYALAVVGAVFLNCLITIAQSFLHLAALKALAPTQQSPVYIAAKVILLLLFLVIAFAAARQASRS